MSFIPGAWAQAEGARLSAWELLGARDASCGRTMERRAADHALRSSDLQRHFRVWVVTPGRERFFSPPALQCSKQLFMSHWWHLQAFRGFGGAWGEGVCAVTAVAIFALQTQILWPVQHSNVPGRCALWTLFKIILLVSLLVRKRGQCFYSVVQAWIQFCSK